MPARRPPPSLKYSIELQQHPLGIPPAHVRCVVLVTGFTDILHPAGQIHRSVGIGPDKRHQLLLQQPPGKISDIRISFFHQAVCVDLHRQPQLPDGLENSRIMTQPDIPLQVCENRLAVALRPDAA